MVRGSKYGKGYSTTELCLLQLLGILEEQVDVDQDLECWFGNGSRDGERVHGLQHALLSYINGTHDVMKAGEELLPAPIRARVAIAVGAKP